MMEPTHTIEEVWNCAVDFRAANAQRQIAEDSVQNTIIVVASVPSASARIMEPTVARATVHAPLGPIIRRAGERRADAERRSTCMRIQRRRQW